MICVLICLDYVNTIMSRLICLAYEDVSTGFQTRLYITEICQIIFSVDYWAGQADQRINLYLFKPRLQFKWSSSRRVN